MSKDSKNLLCAAAVIGGGIYILSKKNNAVSGIGNPDFLKKYSSYRIGGSPKAPYDVCRRAIESGLYSNFQIVYFRSMSRSETYTGLPLRGWYTLNYNNDIKAAERPAVFPDGICPEGVDISKPTADKLMTEFDIPLRLAHS